MFRPTLRSVAQADASDSQFKYLGPVLTSLIYKVFQDISFSLMHRYLEQQWLGLRVSQCEPALRTGVQHLNWRLEPNSLDFRSRNPSLQELALCTAAMYPRLLT